MPTLSQEIRKITADSHQAVEKKLFADHRAIEESEFIRLLQAQYRFQKMLEEALEKTDFINGSDWKSVSRRKSNKIKTDLEHIHQKVSPPKTKNPFSTWTEGELLGAAYVAEGSTLGGKFILNSILKSGLFKINGSRSFLTGYGSATGRAWKRFQNLLEREGKGREDEVLSGAQNAFKVFQNQIEQV